MSSEILINSNPREIRVALMENNQLAELFIEHRANKGIVGNIYKGTVTKVLPGMQVAFVDIGLDKAGFLYVGDVDVSDLLDPGSNSAAEDARSGGRNRARRIQCCSYGSLLDRLFLRSLREMRGQNCPSQY